MNKIAFVFPGQGSQSVGMGRSFFDSSAGAKRAFEEANDALGFDIAALAFSGPQDALDRTENTQPALLAASIAALRALSEKVELKPSCMAGHSLGEYTALVAAGALEFKAAVRLVRLRGKFMQESVPAGQGAMCAVLGMGAEDVTAVCEAASKPGSVVVAANINSPEQVVISGEAGAVERAAALAKEKGAKRVLMLPVSVPSHSPLMQKAAGMLARELEGVEFCAPSVPVITNVEAGPLADIAKVKGLLAAQLTSPVRWVETVRRMRADGVATIVEIGPGKVLSGLVKRIEKDVNTVNIAEAADIDKAAGLIG